MILFSKIYLIPYPSCGFDELKLHLKYIKDKAITPNLDAELPLYIKYQTQIMEEIGINLCLPSQENFELIYKRRINLSPKQSYRFSLYSQSPKNELNHK